MLQLQQRGEFMHHILKKNPLFKNLTEQELDQFIACQKPRVMTYQAKQTVFHKYERLTEIGIVIAGEILLVKEDFFGNESIIQNMTKGQSFGEAIALHPNETTRVRAVAKEMTVVAFFNIQGFYALCAKACDYHQKIQQNLMLVLASKLVSLHKKIDVMSKRTIREKLLDYLSQLSQDKESIVTIPYTRQELANYLNVDRSALAREMRFMIDEGLIEVNKQTIILKR